LNNNIIVLYNKFDIQFVLGYFKGMNLFMFLVTDAPDEKPCVVDRSLAYRRQIWHNMEVNGAVCSPRPFTEIPDFKVNDTSVAVVIRANGTYLPFRTCSTKSS